MSRRKLREYIFKMLFRTEFYEPEELSEQMSLFVEDFMAGEEMEADAAYIQHKYEDIVSHLAKIDQDVNAAVTGWKTSRMGKVDLALIRLAVYEMQYDADIPTGVAINEAVELAKKYGTDDSASFVNGILAKLT